MKILLKYILKCIWQNKVRTGLILCAIMISSAMLFSSVSISTALVALQMNTWRSTYGYSDIIIHGNDSSSGPWFHMNEALQWMPSCEYIVGEVSGTGTLETPDGTEIQTALRGIDWDELQSLTPVQLTQSAGLSPIAGGKLILGKDAAEAFGLSVGDTLYLSINGTRHSLKLSGIAAAEGYFSRSGPVLNAVIPRDRLASMLNIPGRVDRIYIKLKSPELKYRLITKLSISYPRFTVRESFSASEVKRQTDRTAMPIIIVAVILSFMSIYILYSSFKVIMLERLSVIGTFRSIGATIGSTRGILLVESIAYGILGGLAGCSLGVLLLAVMSGIIAPEDATKQPSFPSFNPIYLILAFLVAVLISLAGALVPVMKVSKLPVKDLIFTTLSASGKIKKSFIILGIILFAVSLLSPALIQHESHKWLSTVCVILALISAVLLVPFLTAVFQVLLGWLFHFLFRNEGYLAMAQICHSKSSHNNVALLVIGVAALVMVTTVNDGEIRQIADTFSRCNYDIIVQFSHPNRNNKNLLGELEGIEVVLENQEGPIIYLDGLDEPLYHIQGIDPEEFVQFHTLSAPLGMEDRIEHLDDGKNILLTTTLRDRWSLKVGDPLTLTLTGSHGNKIRRVYTVTGFFDNIFPGLWSYGLISERNFKRDIGINSTGPYYIRSTGDTQEAIRTIQTAFARQKPVVQTIEAMKQEIEDENIRVFTVLRFFSLITAIAGTFGILNNMTISFMERKRTLATLRSLGMTRWKVMKMLLAEGLGIGLLGAAAGAGTGLLILSNIVPYVFKATGSETRIIYSVPVILYCFYAAMVIPVLASAGPMLRAVRMNLISTIQYE